MRRSSNVTEAVRIGTVIFGATSSLVRQVLSKAWSILWRGGVLTALLIVTLVLLAMAQLGLYALAWAMVGPTDDYVTNRWLSMALPSAVGLVVGTSIALRNWKEHRRQTLNGMENLGRSVAGAFAACAEVYMGLAAVRLIVETGVRSAKEDFSDVMTPEIPQAYFEVSLAESFLLLVGIYATVEITRRACFMKEPSAQTARSQLWADVIRNIEGLKRPFTNSRALSHRRRKSYRRAQRRIDSVWRNKGGKRIEHTNLASRWLGSVRNAFSRL